MTDEQCGKRKNNGDPCTYSPKYDDGRCGIHTETNNQGRPSKFDEVEDDLLEAADGFLNLKQVANKGGIHKATLFRYLDEHQGFCDRFKRARGEAANRLVRRALDPDDEIDVRFAQFLLERSFKFIKTERQEIEMDARHSVDASENVTAEFVTYDSDDGDS